MWNRNEVPISCYFPKRGSGGLLFSRARGKCDEGLFGFEDARRGTETKSAKRRTDSLTPASGARNAVKSGINSLGRPEMWNRNEVLIACYFPKRGSGGLLFSEHGKD